MLWIPNESGPDPACFQEAYLLSPRKFKNICNTLILWILRNFSEEKNFFGSGSEAETEFNGDSDPNMQIISEQDQQLHPPQGLLALPCRSRPSWCSGRSCTRSRRSRSVGRGVDIEKKCSSQRQNRKSINIIIERRKLLRLSWKFQQIFLELGTVLGENYYNYCDFLIFSYSKVIKKSKILYLKFITVHIKNFFLYRALNTCLNSGSSNKPKL